MRDDSQGQLALFLVSASLVLGSLMIVLSDLLRRIDWFEPRMLGMPLLACMVSGTVLGSLNLRSTAGKLAAAIGSSILLYLLVAEFVAAP